MHLLENVFSWDRIRAFNTILDSYNQKWYSYVSYLYFANAMKWKLFEDVALSYEEEDTRNAYITVLESTDVLLPDGIALELFYRFFSTKWDKLTNLNGTDFLPFFLDTLKEKGIQAEIIVYWAKEQYIPQLKDHYTQYFPVISVQHWYQEFDWSQLPKKANDTIRLMLVWRWSPLQEIRSYENREKITQHWCLVMNQWWTFDFIVWAETRAPEWMIRARILETFWRICTNPEKNLKKFIDMFGIFWFMWRRILPEVRRKL